MTPKEIAKTLSEDLNKSEVAQAILDKANIKGATVGADGKIYLDFLSINPSQLRALADALEKSGVNEFEGLFSYQKS